mmetsp:Transcript_71930/g.227332  ORF Transcript_71930/g.227332 Transcript_71930/m.227332 type:complete len:315 (+) Transcript_71930:1257-2201(+)
MAPSEVVAPPKADATAEAAGALHAGPEDEAAADGSTAVAPVARGLLRAQRRRASLGGGPRPPRAGRGLHAAFRREPRHPAGRPAPLGLSGGRRALLQERGRGPGAGGGAAGRPRAERGRVPQHLHRARLDRRPLLGGGAALCGCPSRGRQRAVGAVRRLRRPAGRHSRPAGERADGCAAGPGGLQEDALPPGAPCHGVRAHLPPRAGGAEPRTVAPAHRQVGAGGGRIPAGAGGPVGPGLLAAGRGLFQGAPPTGARAGTPPVSAQGLLGRVPGPHAQMRRLRRAAPREHRPGRLTPARREARRACRGSRRDAG